jgi:hypothetical protein
LTAVLQCNTGPVLTAVIAIWVKDELESFITLDFGESLIEVPGCSDDQIRQFIPRSREQRPAIPRLQGLPCSK